MDDSNPLPGGREADWSTGKATTQAAAMEAMKTRPLRVILLRRTQTKPRKRNQAQLHSMHRKNGGKKDGQDPIR
jgi:hypothetical protein